MKTLKSQLQALIISFSFIASILVIAGFIHTKQKDAVQNVTEQLAEIERLVYKDIEVINSFLLFDVIDEHFYSSGSSPNLEIHDKLFDQIEQKLRFIAKNEQIKFGYEIDSLNSKLQLLDHNFAQLIKLQLERGFKDFGIEGSMREDIHWIEKRKAIPVFELLMLRRHEKDYIIRKQNNYIDLHIKLINRILKKLNKSKEVYSKLNSYRQKFSKMIALDSKIGKNSDVGLIKNIKSTYSDIDFLLAGIINQGQTKQTEMIVSYKYSYLSFAIFFILTSLLIGFYISHRISKQLHKLSSGISEFVGSNFTLIPEIKYKENKNEIHQLTKNFLILRNEILDYLKAFEEKVKAQTQTLTIQNGQIQEKNKKIISQKQKLVEQFQTILLQKDRVFAQRKRLLESIKYAKHIQGALLPNSQSINKLYRNNFVLSKPKDIISGDFYWFKKIETASSNLTISIVADCTGHGVPGALLSVLGISYLNDIILNQHEYRPDYILNKLRENFINTLQHMDNQHVVNDGMDIAVCVIDNLTDIMYFAGANRNLYLIRSNKLEIINGNRMPIGKHVNDNISFTGNRTKLSDHDTIYMFTDGYADQFGGEKGAKFMRQRFRKLLLSVQNENFENQKTIINRHFGQWKGSNYQVDDVLVVGFEYLCNTQSTHNQNNVFGVPINFKITALS